MDAKEELLQKVQRYLDRMGDLAPDNADEEAEKKGKEKLESILSSLQGADVEETVSEVRRYESLSDVEQRKLYNFCSSLDNSTVIESIADDITVNIFTVNDNAESYTSDNSQLTVEYHRSLDKDEVDKLKDYVKKHSNDKSFTQTLYRLIDEHKMNDSDVYKNGMLRRQDYHRVKNHDDTKRPISKSIVWNIIFGLRCDLKEAEVLLNSAGHHLRDNKFDLILTYMVQTKNYDVFAANAILDMYDLPLLACYRDVKDDDVF